MTDNTLQVRVEFEGEMLRKVNRLKKYFGMENTTDLIRLLVNDKDRQVFAKEA